AADIFSPPRPSMIMSGSSCRRLRINSAACWSPLASAAVMNTRLGTRDSPQAVAGRVKDLPAHGRMTAGLPMIQSMKCSGFFIALLLIVAPSLANVLPGDKPQLKTRGADGATID